jgi:hypothetical protein
MIVEPGKISVDFNPNKDKDGVTAFPLGKITYTLDFLASDR